MKQLRPAIVLTLFFVIVTGIAFPVAVWAIGQAAFPGEARGSLIRDKNGTVIGSSLIGQAFAKPEYFHPRPSAAGTGYDAANSSGTNLGPTSEKLINGIKDDPTTKDVDESYFGFRDLARAYRAENGLPNDTVVPADAATRSASGLDPHISPANARLQAARIAQSRNLPVERILEVVAQNTEGRLLGLLGEPRVNVLLTNRKLDELR